MGSLESHANWNCSLRFDSLFERIQIEDYAHFVGLSIRIMY